jgi:PAS domain S-box-containing protein
VDSQVRFLSARSGVLEKMVAGAALSDVLDTLCRETEDLDPTFRCSILLLDDDGRTIRHGAAPSLPDYYNQAVDGLVIGENVGSCGTAMFMREPVVVEDVHTHPAWACYGDLVRRVGFRSCWSHPVIAADGSVLGSFALYSDDTRTPDDGHRELIAVQANLARLAIERTKAAEALRESEARFRDFAEVASDWFWTMDEDLRFTWFSDRAEDITGVDPSRALGRTRAELTVDDVSDDHWRRHLDDLDNHRPFRNFLYQQRRDDGSVLYCNVSGKPVFDARGRFRGYRGVAMDITAQITAQQAEREARLSAEQANASKTLFLANMSHDLRTPLNAINGFSEAIAYEVFGPHANPKYAEYAGDIHRSAQYLLGIITDILDFSKIEAGQITPDLADVDMEALVAECVRIVDASHAGAAVTVDIAADAGVVRADARLLRQITINLLSNARKFTPADGSIAVSSTRAGEAVAVCVRDSGVGMAPDELTMALEPFHQVRKTNVQIARDGQGLGLPIAESLTALQGGRFAIESAPGVGTAVTLTFPAPS